MSADAIRSAIEASREREKKATRGPWECKDAPPYAFDGRYRVLGPYNVKPPLHFDDRDWNGEFVDHGNAVFASAARTYEPRFREALAVAVEALGAIYCRHGKLPNGTHSTFSRDDMARHAGDAEDCIAAILAREGK